MAGIGLLVGFFAIFILSIPDPAEARNIKVGVLRRFTVKMPLTGLNWLYRK